MIYENILETIGNTPVVKLQRVAPENQNIYAKLEAFNPLASVKDRLAIAIIEDAEKSGALKPGQTVVEATSGNTGQRLPIRCHHGGNLFRGKAQNHESPGSQGNSYSCCRKGVWHGAPCRGTGETARLVSCQPV